MTNNVKSITIVHGPKGCGKTQNRTALAYYLSADLVFDDHPCSMAPSTNTRKYWRQMSQIAENRDAKHILVLTDGIHLNAETNAKVYFPWATVHIKEYAEIADKAKAALSERRLPFGYCLNEDKARMVFNHLDVAESYKKYATRQTPKPSDIQKERKTVLPLPNINDLGGSVMLADIPDKDTTFIVQRGLLTMVETRINRDEALVVAKAFFQHFDMSPPMAFPRPDGHGPVAWFFAAVDDALVYQHEDITLQRGHAILIAEHIRKLEEQLTALQNKKPTPLKETLWGIYKDENQPFSIKQAAMGLIHAINAPENVELGSVVDKLGHVALITGQKDSLSITAEELLERWPQVLKRLREMEIADDIYRPLRELLGHIEDGSDQVVTIFQDDTTRKWNVRCGSEMPEEGNTLLEALHKHFPEKTNVAD